MKPSTPLKKADLFVTTVALTLALAMFLFVPTANAGNGFNLCDTSEVAALSSDAKGSALLCVNERGLSAKLRIGHLQPGDAYTVWWVYFDDPSMCASEQCGQADFGGDNPLAVFGRMDSGIAPRQGMLRFSGAWRGMQPTQGAQVWLFVFGHGAADYSDGRHLARQLLTPEDPAAGAPHLGNWVDGPLGFPVAISVFTID